MPKILIVRSAPFDANPKGYNVQEMGLSKALCNMGYDVDWFTFKSKKQGKFVFYEKNDCRALCIEVPRVRVLRWGINLELCKKSFLDQYDIVICFEYMQLMTFLIARNVKNGILYSGPYYNLFTLKFISPLFDFVATSKINKAFPKIFTKSILAKEYLEKKGYKNVVSVGVGLDVGRFQRDVDIKPGTQDLINYMKDNKCILYVGTLSKRKNYSFMLDVYGLVQKKYPDLKFVVIGRGEPSFLRKIMGESGDDYIEHCERRMPRRVLDGIKHVEKIDNEQLKFIYPLAKAFLLPSKKEIFGMVLLEAMYLGAPVVTSENGGSKTIIENRESGQIIKKFDASLWADAVIKYLEDSSYTQMITLNAKKIIESECSWATIASKFLR